MVSPGVSLNKYQAYFEKVCLNIFSVAFIISLFTIRNIKYTVTTIPVCNKYVVNIQYSKVNISHHSLLCIMYNYVSPPLSSSLLIVISLSGELELLIAQPQHDVPADQPQTTRPESPGAWTQSKTWLSLVKVFHL